MLPGSVSTAGARISAQLRSEAGGALLALTLTAYEGTVRLTIDEAGPAAGRFRVPEVLPPELAGRERAWTKVAASRSSVRASAGGAAVELAFSPLKLVLSAGGGPAVTFNAGGMLAFEQRRAKGVRPRRARRARQEARRVRAGRLKQRTPLQEDDPAGWWEETFKGHRDSKPHGPEAVAFDLAFPGVQHVFGLPQHAGPLALPATVGAPCEPLCRPAGPLRRAPRGVPACGPGQAR